MGCRRALRPCKEPGCPRYAMDGSGFCDRHHVPRESRRSDAAKSWRYLYGLKAWTDGRDDYLRRHPLCALCEASGHLVPATVVDHKIPHRGDRRLFFDRSNWQSLCKRCHDRKTAREDGGFGNAVMNGHNPQLNKKVYLVCGSPGSGKTTYVKNKLRDNDIVVDVDSICAALSGSDNPHSNHDAVLGIALDVRDYIYDLIRQGKGNWYRAYVITSKAKGEEIQILASQLNAEIVMIESTLHECLERIENDPTRRNNTQLYKDLAIKWHETYSLFGDIKPTASKSPLFRL